MANNPFVIEILTRRLQFVARLEKESEDNDTIFDFSTLKDSVQITRTKKRKEYTSEDPLTITSKKASFGNLKDSVSLAKSKRVSISEENNKIKFIPNLATLAQVSFKEPAVSIPSPPISPNSNKPILKKSSSFESEVTQVKSKLVPDNSAAPECKQQ
jgi:hypothetical protein